MFAMDHQAASSGHAKQYVFVDEYNRHKRLKVMRACDGCRKRKIRCDGALQNGPWPCGACVRLKLKCVPPTLDPDDELSPVGTAAAPSTGPAPSTTPEVPGQTSFHLRQHQNPALVNRQSANTSPSLASYSYAGSNQTPLSASTAPTSAPSLQDDANYYQSQQIYGPPAGQRYDTAYADDAYYSSSALPAYFHDTPALPNLPTLYRTDTHVSTSSGDTEEVGAVVQELTDQMGDLRVEITSVAPFIANYRHDQVEAPTVEEAEILLPASALTDTSVRIPPEMMPHEDRALDYFGYYFKFIHPYVPVLQKSAFYDQWTNARETMSPLLLEALFACVARYLESPLESKRWLALAARHEEHYKDVPRLSTVQAMILLMKARELVPKPGYFYRSWMALKYISTMAVDMGLNDHYDQHRGEKVTCKLGRADCLQRTRIWQTVFALEVFIGGPQGRTDFAVDLESVDLTYPLPCADLDPFEYQTSRRYTAISLCLRNIKMTNNIFRKIKDEKEWALNPLYEQHDKDLVAWTKDLPQDMQIHYPDDGSPPWLGGDHFVAGLHAYHHLVVIMHHRPELQVKLEKGNPEWTHHLEICAESAALICRLQEALIRDFGLHGMMFMLRGINFTVYCVLSCAMLHLIAITCPDVKLNEQARTYFTRHMRVLEQCLGSVSPDIVTQINTLREAFSKDVKKPFELKATLGMRSPTMQNQASPSNMQSNGQQSLNLGSGVNSWSHVQESIPPKTVSPGSDYTHNSYEATSMPSSLPLSYTSTGYDMPTSAYANPPYAQVITAPHQTSSQPAYDLDPLGNDQQAPAWDPSGIIQQWNTAFGPQAQSVSPPSQRTMQASPVMPTMTLAHSTPSGIPGPINAFQTTNQAGAPLPHVRVPTTTGMPMVTPVMWQDAFTSAYVSGHGQKRVRDDSAYPDNYDQYNSKRRG